MPLVPAPQAQCAPQTALQKGEHVAQQNINIVVLDMVNKGVEYRDHQAGRLVVETGPKDALLASFENDLAQHVLHPSSQ